MLYLSHGYEFKTIFPVDFSNFIENFDHYRARLVGRIIPICAEYIICFVETV